MNRIQRKSQGFGPETKTQVTHIAYKPVAHFYLHPNKSTILSASKNYYGCTEEQRDGDIDIVQT